MATFAGEDERRMDVKKASGNASRRAMNERRHELTQRIRKTKRSHLVTLKRRFTTASTTNTHGNSTTANSINNNNGTATDVMQPMEDSTNHENGMMQTSPEKTLASSTSLTNNDPFGADFPSTVTSTSSSSPSSKPNLAQLAWTYIHQKDSPSLLALQTAMARQNANVQTELACLLQVNENEPLPSHDTPALQLANTLGFSLLCYDEQVQLMASRVLTNLAATISTGSIPSGHGICSPSSGSTAVTKKRQPNQFSTVQDDARIDQQQDQDHDSNSPNYYGYPTEGWCDVLIQSKALESLMETIKIPTTTGGFVQPPQSQFQSYHPSPTRQSLHQQSCWALGNICSDSSHARSAVFGLGIYEWLVRNLELGLQWNDAELSRNAAWAITNLIRSTDHNHYGGFGHMSASTLTKAMMSPTLQTDTECGVTWWEVAYEACWILSFLTAKDDTVVQGLMGDGNSGTPTTPSFSCQSLLPSIVEALACRLESATKIIRTADSLVGISRALQMCIPCLRSLGNIATSCQGAHVKALLQARSSRDATIEGCHVQCLSTLIELGSYPAASTFHTTRCGKTQHEKHNELATVAVEAAWAAGSLLCDAGLPDHLSSTQAAPRLLPVLCKTITSDYAKLSLKREAMSAIWNSVAAPPGSKLADMGHQWSSRPIRDEFLLEILHSEHTKPHTMMSSIVDMMVTFADADGVFYAVNVMNALLRRLGEHHQHSNVIRLFHEAHGVDALEAICDHASQVYTSSTATTRSNQAESLSSVAEQSAEIAADLIDDLFDDNDGHNEFGGGDEMTYEPQVKDGQYAFGLGAGGANGNQAPAMFDFSGNGSAVPPPSQQQQQVNPAMAQAPPQGRGRGKPVPSWMQKGPSATPPTATGPMSSYPW
mmetsp:Transcript_8193/g.11812  ORF Transcript_8193/g.11812 Transcript_8193/m.11812 type:complete len:883 (+) Transcript_8193:671-3319(+)